MSDVLAFTRPGSLMLTGLVNIQSVRTADIAEVKAIIYVRGKVPTPDSIELAKEKRIPLLSTNYHMYEACGILYCNGIAGNTNGK
jgi:predicted transcriptional regulator